MNKKIIFIMSMFLLLCVSFRVKAQPTIDAQSAILMDSNTGKILYAKSPNDKLPIASLTKIMTAILAIEDGKLDDEVTISKEAASQAPSKLYLQPGDKLTLRCLMYGMLLQSGNDAAYAIAEHIGGNVENFVKLMNQKAKSLGLENTVYYNPSGLPTPRNNYSTASELAKLMRYAMTNATFRKIDGTKTYSCESMNGVPYSFVNHNKLVRQVPYVIAGKTGFTSKAGRTLVSVAKQNGTELIAVTLNDPSDWKDQLNLFKYGFAQYGIKVETPEIRSEENEEE